MMPLCLRVGHIPEELSNLANLEELDVGMNDLTGEIRQNSYVTPAPPSRLLAIARPSLRRFGSLSPPHTSRPSHIDTRRLCKIMCVILERGSLTSFHVGVQKGRGRGCGVGMSSFSTPSGGVVLKRGSYGTWFQEL